MTATATTKNLQIRFSLILEQVLAFASSLNMVIAVKDLSPNFEQIAWLYFNLLSILIWIVWSIFSLNSRQFQQKLCSNSLHIVELTCTSYK